MTKKFAWCWIAMGAMLLLAALFLILFNLHRDQEGAKASTAILTELKQDISEHPQETETETVPYQPTENLYAEYEEATEPPAPTDPMTELDGARYIGIISIPRLGVELPVMQEWSYPNLRIAPCRYVGAAASGNLIIAAHNYRSHFAGIQTLNTGDIILFTNVLGEQYTYEVVQSEMVGGRDVEMMVSGSDEGWDLTLFTCTLSGQTRVTVRAQQVIQE